MGGESVNNYRKFLSVVIITCNRQKELLKTIDSCIKKVNMPMEIIVVDNGSTDGTKEMLSQLQKKETITVVPFFSDINLGVSGGRNKGYELASSEIVLFIDDDAIFDENSETLDLAFEYMMKNKKIGALAFDIYDLKEKGKLLDAFKYNDINNKEMLSYVGACHMLRKTLDRKYLYPPKLMYGAEERYASILYYDLGFRVEFYSGVKVNHNPSTKTRMSRISTYRNVMINQYVIKKLLLPSKYHVKADVFFLLRQVKREKFNIFQIFKNYREAKKRIRQNVASRKEISIVTINKIRKEYGEFVIL